MNFLNRLPEIFTLRLPTCPPFHSLFLEEVSPCSCAAAKNIGTLLSPQRVTSHLPSPLPSTSAEHQHLLLTMKSPLSSHVSYQFQPCLLDGEYLSISAVSLSRESFCSRRNWEADWFSTPGLVGREGRLCSLDQCRCWLTLLVTQQTHIVAVLTREVEPVISQSWHLQENEYFTCMLLLRIFAIKLKWWLLSHYLYHLFRSIINQIHMHESG